MGNGPAGGDGEPFCANKRGHRLTASVFIYLTGPVKPEGEKPTVKAKYPSSSYQVR